MKTLLSRGVFILCFGSSAPEMAYIPVVGQWGTSKLTANLSLFCRINKSPRNGDRHYLTDFGHQMPDSSGTICQTRQHARTRRMPIEPYPGYARSTPRALTVSRSNAS